MIKQIFILIISVFFLFSCVTEPSKNATLSGKIDNANNFVVAVYELAILDKTIKTINSENPNIGLSINQETEFDHRLQSPVKYTYADENGIFSIDDLTPGIYNIVLQKDGLFMVYIYNLIVVKGKNNIAITDINNFKIVTMPQSVTTPFVFKSGTQYYFPQNTIFTEKVNIESGAILAIEENRKIEFHNDIITPVAEGKYFWITSASILNFSPTIQPITMFDRINISSTEPINLSNAKITFINSGVNFSVPSGSISHSYFNHNNNALIIDGGEVNVKNIVHLNSKNRSIDFGFNQALTNNKINYLNNISFYNDISVYSSRVSLDIINNYMSDNETAVHSMDADVEVMDNIFTNNNKAVEILGSYAIIKNNNFIGNGIDDIIFGESSSRKRADGIINYNNFMKTNNIYLRMTRTHGFIGTEDDIDAKYNYFANENIENQIRDKNREPSLVYEFIIHPRLTTPNP